MAALARRAFAFAALASAGALLGGVAACGLSLSGLSSSTDDGGTARALDATRPTDGAAGGGGKDAGDSSSPGCATLDAACLGAVPSGWVPVALGDAGCAAGYTTQGLVANPRLLDGGCACGACQVVGTFDCNAMVDISGGDGCGDPTLITVTPGVCGMAQAQHVEAHAPQATGSVGCFVPTDAGTGVVTDPLTLCVPGCSVDYCQGVQRCIAADGDQPCPSGFTLQAKAGTGADPGCAPCACEAGPPGTCGGSVTAYDNAACADSGAAATYAVGTCNQYSTTNNYQSLLVHLVPPVATCTTSTTVDVGDASLTGVKTICCR